MRRTNRWLGIFLTFVLIVSALCLNVWATEGSTDNSVATIDSQATGNVAKVGNTEYATIDEAIAAWTNNTTLTLLSDVTLSDVVTLNSTEHHILNLGTYTLTAASGKNAFVIKACGTGSAERSAITINADATNPGGINAGSKSIVYYKYADGGISTEDRPIIKINGGVFTGSTSSWGTAGIYTIGTAARKCATVNVAGGTFNCSIVGSGKSKLIVSGGTFNYSVSSQGDSTCSRLISGGTFKSFGFMTADSNNTKFWIGTSMGNSNVGTYIDDNGYLVVGGPVVTEPGEAFEASSPNHSNAGFGSYLTYSSAATNGIYYTSVEEALADNNKASGSVTVYVDELDMTDISYKGTIVVPEGETITIVTAAGATPTWTVTAAEGAVTYTDTEGNELVTDENGALVKPSPVKVDGVVVEITNNGNNSYDIKLGDEATFPEEGVTMTFSTTGDANGMAYVVHEHEGVNYIYVGKVADSKLSFTNTVGFSTFTVVDGGLQDAIKAAAPGGTVEILSDITVDKWIMFAEKMNIGDGTLITLNINGLTIDGNGHTLTVNSIESAGNGGYLFYDAQNLNVKDLTINIADGLVGGIGLQSGTISNVTFNGGQYGVLPGKNGVTIDGCTFNDTKGYAIYYEDSRENIVVESNEFNTADGAYAITMRSDEQFTNNTITKGKVNLANSAKSTVSGNDFGTERFKVYNAATATISDNKINNLVFNETNAPADSTFTDDNTLSAEAQAAIDALPTLAGEGTVANPYIINNLAQLKAFRDEVNAGNNYSGKYVKLNADINLNNEEWTPIGNSTNKFMGYFDGNNKTISNLKVTGNNRHVGLFGYIQGNGMSASTTPSVKDLTLTDVSVSGDYYVGGLSGQAYTCNITNVHVSGTVSGTRYVGGLVGHVYTYFKDCSFNGEATCSFDALGGIAGAGDCRAYDCSVIGTISGSNWVGGIVGNGQEGTSAVGCYVKATVSTGNNYYRGVGGIAGVAGHGYSTSEFKNNYFDGEVYLAGEKVDAIIMGIVNANDNASIGTTVEGNSWNTAYYPAETPVYVVAEISSSTASSDEWKAGASEEKSSVRNNNLVMYESDLAYVDATSADDVTILPGSSVTEEQVEQAVFDNNAVAKIDDVKYATLQEALNAAAAGTGNVTVEILNDIDLTSVVWSPVTVSAPGYPLVTVNGNDKTITGLNDMLFAGTWAGGSGLIINDLTIANSTIVHDENDAAGNIGVGAFIGFPQASSIITLNNCHLVDSTVKGGHWTGGLIGYAAGYAGNDGPVFMNLTIKDCSVTGSVITGKGSAGGVIGHATGNAWTNVAIETTTVSGNTVTSTGSSTNKAGAVVGTIGAAGQATTVNGVEKTGGVAVSATVSGNTVKSSDATITTVYGRQGTNTGMLEIAGGSYDSNPIEENVSYAAPAEGYMIVENTDGSFGLAVDPAYGKVAMIGDTYYETLAEAITAAQAGDELILLADVDGNVTVPADIIFNGNGKQITGTLYLMGDVTFKGYTKANAFDFENVGTEINIPVGATFELTGTGRMIIGHGCTFNIEGTITDAKTADKATLTPSLIMPGASFTGAGVTFNVTNAYIKTTASYCSSSKYASDTFDFNITNSIWEQFGKLAFEAQSTAATVNFELKDSVLTTTSHLVFGVSSGEIVIDNSNVNVGTSRQIENRSTMTIKNGSVVNGAVATSSNAINPGTIIVENATYAVTGQFSGAAEGTGTLVIKKGATVSVGSIVNNANIQIDATGMAAGDVINLTADLSALTGSVEVINNSALEAQIVDGKIVLAVKPVAKIGDVEFTTLKAAFAAAQAGDEVVLLADVADAGQVTLKAGVTFNGNGKILSGNTSIINQTKTEGKFVIKNVIFKEISNGKGTLSAIYIERYPENSEFVIDGCTFDGVEWDALAITLHGYGDTTESVTTPAIITVTNNIFKDSDETTASKRYIHFQPTYNPESSTIYTKNPLPITFTMTGNKIYDDGVETAVGIWYADADSTQVISGNYIENLDKVAVMVYSDKAENAMETILPLKDENLENDITYAAMITDGNTAKFYATLADALAVLQANGGTLELLADASINASVVVLEDTVINGNGKKLTVTGAYGIDVKAGVNLAINNLTVESNLYALNLRGASDNAEVTITDSNLTGCIALNVWGKNVVVNATNSAFTSVDASTQENYSAIVLNNNGSYSAENTVINITGGSITALDENGAPSIAIRNATATGVANVSDTTVVTGEIREVVSIVTYNGSDAFYSHFTLQNSINKAANDSTATVKLLKDITISEKLVIEGNVTIDGNGKTITYTGSDRAIDVPNTANGANVTIKNLTLDFTGGYSQRGINYNTNGKLILDNVTVNGTNVTYAVNMPSSSDNAEVEINNSSITGLIALNVWGANAKVDVTNTDLTSVDEATHENYAAVKLNNNGTDAAEGAVITINGGSITALDENGNPSSATTNATATGVITISDTTVVTGNHEKNVAAVLYSGASEFYGCFTLQEAIDKAANDPKATVKLLRNITESVTITGTVVLDLNGKTISGDTSPIVIDDGGELTIKDSASNGAVVATGNFAVLLSGSGKLTLESGTLKAGSYAVYLVNADSQFVMNGGTVEGNMAIGVNGGNAVIKSGTIIAHDMAAPMYVWSGSMSISGGTFSFSPSADYIAYGYGITENADGTYTVSKVDPMIFIGSNSYYTLDEAFKAASENDVITITKAGKYTWTNTAVPAGVTVKGTVEGVVVDGNRTIINATKLTVENIDFTALNEAVYITNGKASEITFTDCSFTGNYSLLVDSAADGSVFTFNNCIFNGFTTFASSVGAVNVNGGEINHRFVVRQDVEIKNAVISEVDAAGIQIGTSDVVTGVNVTMTGCTVKDANNDGTVPSIDELIVTNNVSDDSDNMVVVDGEILYGGVAKIGETRYATFVEAFAAAQPGDTITLLADVELDATLTTNKSITIDGNGKTITTSVAFVGNASNAMIDIQKDITFNNVVFDGVKGVAVMRAVSANVVMDECVVKNCEQTVSQGLLRLACGNATITNSQFLDNDCTMVLSFGYDAANDTDVLLVDNCTFEGNTCGDVAVVYFADGNYGKVTNTKFIDNSVSSAGNAATLYMGWGAGFEVSGCLFDGNSVTTSHATTKRFASAIFADGCKIENNIFLDNSATRNGETIKTVVAVAAYYGEASVSGNYWNGGEPAFTIEYNRNDVLANTYYTTYDESTGALSGLTDIDYVAKVGATPYKTLADAIAAAQAGDTILLLDNATVTEKFNLTGVNLNLNGKTLYLKTTGNYIVDTVTISNGTIDISGNTLASGTNTFFTIGGQWAKAGSVLNLDKVNLVGDGYRTEWAVICVHNGTSLNMTNSTVDLKNDNGAGGGFIKDTSGNNNTADVVISNTTITLANVDRGFTGAKVTLDTVDLTITGGEHGINGSELLIKNSTVSISDGTGRGITLNKFNSEIVNSTVTLTNMGEGGIRFKTANALTVDADSTLAATSAHADVAGATVNGREVTGTEDDMSTVTVADGTTTVVNPYYEAKIGDTKYASIAGAIEAAQPGETVTILAGDYATNLNVNKAITVVGETDAEGNNLVNITGKLNITADGATVKTLNVNNGSGNGGYINAKDVLVEGCTVVGGNGFRSCYTEGTVTFRDSTITGSTYGIHFDGSEGGEIVIDNCVITGWTSFARAIKKVSMTDTKFEEGNYNYVRFYQEEVVIDGCTFNENMAVDLAVSDATLTVTNSTLENGNVIDLFEGKDIVNSNITVDGTKLVRVAKIGDTYYETLAAALAAAKAGDVVDLLGNSFVDAAGFSLNGFTLANGSITFKKGARIGVHGDAVLDNVDLTFDMDGTSGYPNTAIYINGGSATSLTLKNGSDVLIKNPGYTAIYNDGTTAYALNIDNSTLTIEGKGTSTGINVANITLTNGKLTTSNTGIAINGGSVNVDGTSVVTVNGTNSHGITNVVLTVAAGGEVDVDNCAFLGLNIKDGSSIAEGATVTVDNCGTSGNYVGIPARMNGTISGYDSILVDNAKIVAQGASGNAFNSIEAALAAAKDGETITLIRDVTTTSPISITKSLTIDGGDHTLTYTGTDRAIDVPNTANGANVTIKNLNINAENANRGLNYNTTGEFTVENVVVTIGANVDGYAINFPGSADGAKVTITNCALTSRTPLNIWGENMEINVVDSEITSVDNSSTYFYSAIQLNNDGYTCANGTVVTVTGGKLTARDEEGEASFAVTNWSETGIVNISATTEVIGTVQEVVAWIGGVGFTSLQAAINSEYTGTIKILRDFAISKSVTVPAGKNVTIDLNGKTISGSSSESTSYAMLTNKGDLTIKDSVGGGKITYVYTGASSNYSFTWGNYTILNSGELTVESGTIENTTNLTGHMFSAIDNHSGGVVTINGGTISCPNYVTIRQFASSATADNTVVINGGTVSGKFALWPQNANGNADTKATLTLNGGIIEGSSKALYIGGPLADTFTITKSASLDLAAPADHKWVEQDGEYVLAACVYVAELNGTKYESLADALTAAQDGDTVTLIWADGDAPIAMNGAVYGKTVTITGTATVDWSKGFLFVGRGGAGNGTVIFENAVLTSASDNASTGIHVSGREKDTNNKYDGTLVINNSTIELDYLINKGDITLDNSTLTVKNGFSIGGRPASETESGVDATATITLNNGSKVVVNKHNGMGLGYEAIGVMNIDATSTFETTQSFLVTAKGTMNIAGKVVIAGTLTNNGQIVLTDAAATLTSSECGNVTTNVADHKVAYANGTYSVVKNENKIISYSLSLEGEIAYRVTYQLNADTLADENAKIVFSFVRDGEPVVVEIPVNNGVSKGDNKYQYSVDLYSFEMMTDITSKLVIGTTEQENCTATASIRDYAEYVLGSETSAEYTDDLKAMLKAMLNYGAYAQTYFGYNAEDLANAGYETDLSVVKATDVTNINAVSGSLDGIAIRGVSLELKARTSLRFVFTVAEGYSIDDYTFKYGDTELEVESLSDGSYRVCVENINVFELDNAYTVDVTMEGNAENTYSVTSSALSYVSIVLNGQYEDGIVNLCKALYLYNQAGNTYYGR